MNKKVCDRCGQEITKIKGLFKRIPVNADHILIVNQKGWSSNSYEFDLCENCMQDLSKFLCEKKEKEVD